MDEVGEEKKVGVKYEWVWSTEGLSLPGKNVFILPFKSVH